MNGYNADYISITGGDGTFTVYPSASWWVRPQPQANPFDSGPKVDLEELTKTITRILEAQQSSIRAEVEARKKLEATERKEVRPMKSVFTVVVVTKKGEIILDKRVVAKDRDEALFEADVSSVLKAKGLKPGDVTMLAVKFGDVEIEPEPQKVQIVEKSS